MNEQYEAWLKSGHRHAATCVDCHLPHAGLAKWVAKADHGFRHSAAFTLQNFKEPIEITPRDREIVQDNCVRCHARLRAGHARRLAGSAGEPRLPALPRRRRPRRRRLTRAQEARMTRRDAARTWWLVILGFLGVAGLTVLLLALLTNIFERKQEARQPFVRLVEVTEDTMDPKVWGQNWPASTTAT